MAQWRYRTMLLFALPWFLTASHSFHVIFHRIRRAAGHLNLNCYPWQIKFLAPYMTNLPRMFSNYFNFPLSFYLSAFGVLSENYHGLNTEHIASNYDFDQGPGVPKARFTAPSGEARVCHAKTTRSASDSYDILRDNSNGSNDSRSF